MFKEMCEAGFVGLLIARTNVIEDVHHRDLDGWVLVDQHFQSIRQCEGREVYHGVERYENVLTCPLPAPPFEMERLTFCPLLEKSQRLKRLPLIGECMIRRLDMAVQQV